MTDGSGKQLSVELILGDCLEEMAGIPDGSIAMVLCDLPYGGMTACAWDVLIPFEPLWEHYKRVIKPNGAVVLFGVQPFTSALIMSNPRMFKHEWIWEKDQAPNFACARFAPLKVHESAVVFAPRAPTYNPQMWDAGRVANARAKGPLMPERGNVYGRTGLTRGVDRNRTDRFPRSVQRFATPKHNGTDGHWHPTQKPVALCSYLIKTYTDPGETVLDNCMGSASTGVACLQTGRNFIGIERDASYYDIARRRLADAQAQLTFTDGNGVESV